MTETVFDLPGPDDTDLLGRAVATVLEPGQVVFLEGELGAGKTTLVRSILAGLGWTGPVRSPSYALVHGYPAITPPIQHLDLYRLGSAEEALGLDLDHLVQDGCALLIEWADRLEGAIPPDFTVRLEITGSRSRRARILERGDAYIGARIIAQGVNPT